MNGVAEQWNSAPCAAASPSSSRGCPVWRQQTQTPRGIECKRQPMVANLLQVDGFTRCTSIHQKSDEFNHTTHGSSSCSVQSVNLGRVLVCGKQLSSSEEISSHMQDDRKKKSSSNDRGFMIGGVAFYIPPGGVPRYESVENVRPSLSCGGIEKLAVNFHQVDSGNFLQFLEEIMLQKENALEEVLIIRDSENGNFQSLNSFILGKFALRGHDEAEQAYSRNEVSFAHTEASMDCVQSGFETSVPSSWAGCVCAWCASRSVTAMVTNSGSWDQKRLFGGSKFYTSKCGAGRRLWSRRPLVSVSATAQSAEEVSIEGSENSSIGPEAESRSIPKVRRPNSYRGIQAVEELQKQLNARRPVTDPWFANSQEHKESSRKVREKVMKKTSSKRSEDLSPQDETGSRKVQQAGSRPQSPDGNRRAQLWGLGTKAKTVVPRRQPRDIGSPVLTETVDSVLQALERISNTKGVAKIMEEFVGMLSTQDLKQVLTELGAAPERNWAKALQVFDWIHATTGYSLDEGMYHSMLFLLGKAKKMDIAELLFDRMIEDGLTPGQYEYTALVAGHVRSGNLQKGIATIDRMKAAGIRPSVAAYNVLVDGCLKVPKGFEIASSLLEQMRNDDLNPDRVTYTTMIIVYSRKGHHKDAIKLFQEMQQRRCHPDILTFNAVLNAHGKLGDVQGMLQIHRSMIAQQVDPDTVTYNIILSSLARAGRTKDVCRFYRLMRKTRVTPDVTTCSILVNAYGKAREWDELDALLGEMEILGVQPDLAVYNSLISIYGKAGRFEQVELLTKSLHSSNNIGPDVITYNTLIDVFGKAGRLSDVIKWFSDMRKRGVKPDVRTFNALVHAYGRASQYEGVKEVVELFRADGSKPDLVFYHTLLFMFGKGAKYADAWQVIEDMKEEGYTLSLEIYNSLLLVFGRSNAEEAMKVFKDMVASKVQPNSNTFKVLIEVHARKGKVDDCLDIYRTSTKFLNEQVNDSVLSSLLGACCNMRRIDEAEEILTKLEKKGCTISLACFNWLILGYGRKGEWAKAEKVLERMRVQQVTPNSQSYTFLLEAYSLCGLYGKAEALGRRMHEDGNANSISACNALLRFHVRSGKPRLAVQIFEDLLVGKIGNPNQSSYIGIISAYGEDQLVNEKIWEYIRNLEACQLESKHGIYTALLGAIPKCKSQKEAQQFVSALVRLECPGEFCCTLKETMSDGVDDEIFWVNLASRFRTIDKNGFNLETQRAFQNALIDALWWFGWELRAIRVVKISVDLGTFGHVYGWGRSEWTADMRGASSGAAQILLLLWIASMRKAVLSGETIAKSIKIFLAEQWQLIVSENKTAREAVDAHLKDLGAPFPAIAGQTETEASGSDMESWLRKDHLEKMLVFVESLPLK